MWNLILVFWLSGAIATFGTIVSQHLAENPNLPRAESLALMSFMAVVWFLAIPYSIYNDLPRND
tara:strand:- start:415 stop:606 length:192 start_codon:yes stop_codon:yes gene_type:complete